MGDLQFALVCEGTSDGGLTEGVVLDLIFVHRDSDTRDSAARYEEITEAARELDCAAKVVAVVPIQETEAWLLTDESAIRTAVGRPSGRVSLNLPGVRRIEDAARPKEILQGALKTASESSGARLKKVAAQFPGHRARLLERLDIDGAVNELASWRRFVDDLTTAARRIRADAPGSS